MLNYVFSSSLLSTSPNIVLCVYNYACVVVWGECAFTVMCVCIFLHFCEPYLYATVIQIYLCMHQAIGLLRT